MSFLGRSSTCTLMFTRRQNKAHLRINLDLQLAEPTHGVQSIHAFNVEWRIQFVHLRTMLSCADYFQRADVNKNHLI